MPRIQINSLDVRETGYNSILSVYWKDMMKTRGGPDPDFVVSAATVLDQGLA